MKIFLKTLVCVFFVTSFALTNACYAVDENDSDKKAPLEDIKLDLSEKLYADVEAQNDTLKGSIVKDINFFVGYKGFLNIKKPVDSDQTSVIYDASLLDIWTRFDFNDQRKTDLKIGLNPLRNQKDYNYFWGMFQDVYVSTEIVKNNRLLFGQSKPQIGVEGCGDPFAQLLANRSMIARTFNNVRAPGVKLLGNYKYADYSLGIYDSGRYFNNMFEGSEFTGWVNFKPLAAVEKKYGKLTAGTGLSSGRRNSSYTVAGAYLGYDYKKLSANFEYAHANGYNGIVISQKNAQGFYSTLAYQINPKIQLVGRYDFFDSDKQKSKNSVQEYSAGVNYFIKKDKIKLTFNYVFKNVQSARNSSAFVIMMQLIPVSSSLRDFQKHHDI